MKTKIFLLSIIAMLSTYIVYISYDEAHHEHASSETKLVDLQTSLGNIQVEKVEQNEAIASKVSAKDIASLHSHDGSEHIHKVQTNSPEANEEGDHHHIIPRHIKANLCINDARPETCTVDIEKNLYDLLVDQSGNLLADEITTVLDATNYQEVLDTLSSQKQSNEAFVREDDYQHELNQLSHDLSIVNSKVHCSEHICAMTLQYDEPTSSKIFFDKFFRKSGKGNIFISQHYSKQGDYFSEKVMFFPGNNNSVLVPNSN